MLVVTPKKQHYLKQKVAAMATSHTLLEISGQRALDAQD